jgi:hypothetical protein
MATEFRDRPGELKVDQSGDVVDHSSASTWAPLFGGSSLASKLADVEAILGLVFTGFITLMVVVGVPVAALQLLLYRRPPLAQWWWGVLVPSVLAVLFLQWKTLQAVGASMELVDHPRPVGIALTQRAWPSALRPLVALWWWGQCAFLLLAARLMTAEYHFVNPSTGERIFEMLLKLTLLFMAAYASTTSFLFGLAALGMRRGSLLRVWRVRGLIDVGAALLTAMIPLR